MKIRILLIGLILILAGTASAVDLTCTVPSAFVTRATELCEELRLRLHVRTADWDNDVCSTEFLRLGLLAGEKESTRLAARNTVRDDVTTAVDSFRTDFPRVTAAICGDSTVDLEFNEQCDDGNTTDGDGCDSVCQNE